MGHTQDMPLPTCCTAALDSSPVGRKTYGLLFHMINAGEITVGEARAELSSPILDADSAALLAGWVLASADLGDDYYAGANEPTTHPDAELVGRGGATCSFPAGTYTSGL